MINNIILQIVKKISNFNILNLEFSSKISIKTFHLIIGNLYSKIQNGLTIHDINNVIISILCIRFLILTLKHNIKTSFYITSFGMIAGFFWYRNLLKLIGVYRIILAQMPFLGKLGRDAIHSHSEYSYNFNKNHIIPWYKPGKILYDSFLKGVTNIDSKTKLHYYMDPISMLISRFKLQNNTRIGILYYTIYPKAFSGGYNIFCQLWAQIANVAAYVTITRLGKRYCPYLIRWHWTFILLISLVEQLYVQLIIRIYYFQMVILFPDAQISMDPFLLTASTALHKGFIFGILIHFGFTIFALLHALCGQYFYIPFFVENVEFHVGLRPKHSIYSGGFTSWQDPKEKKKLVSKMWYGWFGKGSKKKRNIIKQIKNFLKFLFKL